MASIPQSELFSWEEIEASSDLDRLKLVLDSMPDEALMIQLELARRNGRDDYPVRATWNSVLAGIVFEHEKVENLRRELSRNAELRALCGFDPYKGEEAVPTASAYSRFLKSLYTCQEEIDAIFDELVETLRELLPGFARRPAVDSKAVSSYGRPTRHEKPDGRRDTDADWGAKTYRGVSQNGTLWEKVKRWFGYKPHLIVDTDYELPVAYTVTKAGACDCTEFLPLMEQLDQRHPELLEDTQFISGDKGYDSKDNNRCAWDLYRVKPIFDIRSTWREDPEPPRQLYPQTVDTIFYTEKDPVLCRCRDDQPEERDNYTPMVFEGFEADRESLKYRCPAAVKGIACTQRDLCNAGVHTPHGRIVRVPIEKDRRIFTPQARDSKTWTREHKHRTAVERVNSRLDVSFGFERHFIRGLKKMTLRAGLALCVMLAMAVGRIQANQRQRMRSLVTPAA